MKPLIFETLQSHCNDTITGHAAHGCTTGPARLAGKAMLGKLNKYKEYLNSQPSKLVVAPDPATPNAEKVLKISRIFFAVGCPMTMATLKIKNNVVVKSN